MSTGLLDTSVFIATETGRPLDVQALPDESYVCVITLAELRVGVHAAPDTDTRALRMRTLEALSALTALSVDEAAAAHWARLRHRLVETARRVNVNDLWIASVALAHDLPVVSQDDDFDVLLDLGGPALVRV